MKTKDKLKLQLADFILNTATKEGRYQGRTIYSLDTDFPNGKSFDQIEFGNRVAKIKEAETL